jgi:hypothetical protein
VFALQEEVGVAAAEPCTDEATDAELPVRHTLHHLSYTQRYERGTDTQEKEEDTDRQTQHREGMVRLSYSEIETRHTDVSDGSTRGLSRESVSTLQMCLHGYLLFMSFGSAHPCEVLEWFGAEPVGMQHVGVPQVVQALVVPQHVVHRLITHTRHDGTMSLGRQRGA